MRRSARRAIRATGSIATRATPRAIISTPSARFGYSDGASRSFRPPTLFDTITAGKHRAPHPFPLSSCSSPRIFVEAGLLLIVAPWTASWEQNYFGTRFARLGDWMANEFVRGAVRASA